LEEIAKNMGGKRLSDFAFVMKWAQMTEEQKNTNYSAKTSHELNVFLYFKDKEYFNRVVRPFIACKLEKTFIDYYLLDMLDFMMEFAYLPKVSHLNALEKCLLLEALVRHGKSEEATAVHRHINDQGEVFKKGIQANANANNRIFDIVLSLNALKSSNEKGDLDRFLADQAHDALGLNN